MKGAVAAMAIGGVLAIGGFPTAAFIAADNEFGGDTSDTEPLPERIVLLAEDDESPKWDERRPDLFPRLHEWGEWMKCVVDETRANDGAFDPEEVCGELPDELELELPGPRELPVPPDFPHGLPKDMEDLREWMRCAFEERRDGTELENLEQECGEAPTPDGRRLVVPDWREG